MPTSTPVARIRGRVGALERCIKTGERPKDDPALPQARQALAVEMLAERAARLVAEWPDLTDEQVDRIAAILRGGGE